MNTTRHKVTYNSIAAAVLATMLTACGGGGDSDNLTVQAEAKPTTGERSQKLSSLGAKELFDWAQIKFPDLLAGQFTDFPLLYQGTNFSVRHIPGKNAYLGLSANGEVFALAPFTNNALQSYGPLSGFRSQVETELCAGSHPSCNTLNNGAPTVNVQAEFSNGLLNLSGLNFTNNGVRQVLISKTTLTQQAGTSEFIPGMQKIAGVVTSIETPRSPLGFIDDIQILQGSRLVRLNSRTATLEFTTPETATLKYNISGINQSWVVSLLAEDVSSRKVSDFFTLPVPESSDFDTTAVFVPGDKAYQAKFISNQDMSYVSTSSNSIGASFGNGFGATAFVSRYFCYGFSETQKTPSLALVYRANGDLELFNTTNACDIDVAPKLQTGSWTKEVRGAYTVFKMTYPDSVKNGVLSSLFTNDFAGMPDFIVVDFLDFYTGFSIKQGDAFIDSRKFFSSSSLPALKALGRIQ